MPAIDISRAAHAQAVTPYSRESLADFLGTPVVSSCNRGVVLMMARQAYRRAVQLTRIDESAPVLGVAATCALVSAQPKKGDHRAWAAVHDDVTTHVLGISLAKGERCGAGSGSNNDDNVHAAMRASKHRFLSPFHTPRSAPHWPQ